MSCQRVESYHLFSLKRIVYLSMEFNAAAGIMLIVTIRDCAIKVSLNQKETESNVRMHNMNA